MKRRDFFRLGLAGSALAWGGFPIPSFGRDRTVSMIVDPSDPITASSAAGWAVGELGKRLTDAGIISRTITGIEQADEGDLCIMVASSASRVATTLLRSAAQTVSDMSESLILQPTVLAGRQTIILWGVDERAVIYGVLELCDRIRFGATSESSFGITRSIGEKPANQVRSVMKQFTSEPLDKPWFYDRESWSSYLTMLATQRFNRFHLAFGLGYDFLQRVTDSYLLFLYPFLLDVPGYNVRMSNLTDAERDRNLEMLRFISEETVARGMEFQLGIWTHGYFLANSPGAQHRVEGLTDETHAAYCRDGLTAVLTECPSISAVALRIHGESGIAEGSYDFWSTVFDGVPRSGRSVEIDLHAKGIDQRMIDQALATGMPVNVSPKLHAEHMGLPYHQTTIREWEMPEPGQTGSGLMSLSEGQRSFTRYGYADLLQYDRAFTVRHRVFSGTQRMLAWGDPAAASAYSRAFQFCGSTGFDLMEPLTCRGRRGTGVGTRLGYTDLQLAPRRDWEKYSLWYRTFGRAGFNPDTDGEVFRREYSGANGARALESSLTSASRILPIVTTTHLPSAACDAYWPEIYWNQPIVEEGNPNPYFDTPLPTTFQHVGALDPQLFISQSDFAGELLRGERSGKYSPVEVATWLENHAEEARSKLAEAGQQTSSSRMRLAIDISMLVALGLFFASKFRSGVLYSIYEQTGDQWALLRAIETYRQARKAWAALSDLGGGIYQADLSASDKISERGQWTDRLGAIDADIAQMEAKLDSPVAGDDPVITAAIVHAEAKYQRTEAQCAHAPVMAFTPGDSVELEVLPIAGAQFSSVALYYRHVNQAERFQVAGMVFEGGVFRGSIPAAYTDSPFELQYYFELKEGPENAWLYPGFAPDLLNQPYFVLERT